MPRSRYGHVLWDPAGRWIGYYRDLDDEVHDRGGRLLVVTGTFGATGPAAP
jgi:hypothetical protein